MLQKRVSQQQRTIQYIKQKYKQKTGQQIVLPKKWQDYLVMDQQQCPIQPLPQVKKKIRLTPCTFMQKFSSYQLPSRISFTKVPYTNFSPNNPFHMIQSLQLNNFKQNGFSKMSFRQIVNRIVDMRCLKAVGLSNNGVDQNCAEQVQALLNIKRITRIDLSRNQMAKTCLQIINKNFNHLQWLDISRNHWIKEIPSLGSLVSSIRTNVKLFHLCLDVQDERLLKQLVNYIKIKTNINSFGLIDSKYDNQAMSSLVSVLQPGIGKKQNPSRIIHLNFTFCYLQTQPFNILLKSLSNNTSLISLNLSSNQLMQTKSIQLLSILQSHLTLIKVDLSNNQLQDRFACRLAQYINKNQIIQLVNIQRNNITDQGATQIYHVLSQVNDTLESLGKIQTNQRISLQYLQKISKALRINKISKEIRAQLTNQQGQLSATDIANKQTEAFLQAQYQQYELLEPIAITNPLRQDPYKLNIWQFDD